MAGASIAPTAPDSRPRASWRSRVREFVLDINPPWWGRAMLWALVGMLLLAAGAYPSLPLNKSYAMVNFSFSRAADGSWQFDGPNSRGDLNFFGNYSYTEGLGWQRWDHVMTGIAPGDRNAPIPPPGMTMDQVVTLGRKGYRQLMDDFGGVKLMHGHQDSAIIANGLSMLSRSQRHYATGPLIAARPFLVALGAAALFPALAVGFTRQVMRIRHFNWVKTAESGRCPRCGYSLTGLGIESICPECGLDIIQRVRRSRDELGGRCGPSASRS